MGLFSELCEKHGCDKCDAFLHTYADVYEAIFDSHRWSIQRILEIGIGTEELMKPIVPDYEVGAGLRLFKEYFPNSLVHGIDIDERSVLECIAKGFHCRVADQNNSKSLLDAVGSLLKYDSSASYDLIVDDGCHNLLAQLHTMQNLWERLNSFGFYVIEDVSDTEALRMILSYLPEDGIVFRVHATAIPNDCMVVFRKL